MATERSNHERGKSDLNKELENVLKAATALASNFTSQEVLPSEITQNLCNVVEAVFIHGLRDPFFLKGSRYAKYPEPNFWPFVSKYSHRNITNQINALNQIKSEIGKGRAWIRIVLNEFSLEHYLQLLLQERKAMSQFYNDWAFLRDSEQVDRMLGFVKTLSGIPVNAAINTGLVTGKPIKVGALQIHRKPSVPSIEPVETGVSALEYLPSTLNVLSPIRGNQRNVIMTVVSDDDASSIYSHPSMLDRHERTNILQAASSPKDPLFINQQQASLCISRRTKRPRRSSRSSSESNSQGTRKSEGTSRSRLDSEIPSSVPNDVFVETVSEQAVPTASVSSAEETSSEKNENEAGASSNTSEDVPIETSPSTARVIREVRETEELEDEEREQEKEKHSKDNGESEPTVVCDSCSPKKEIVQEVEQEVLAKDEELPNEPEVFPSKDYEVTKSMGIDIYPGRHHDDSMLGTSLHDELSAISSPPVGNALSSSGAWTVPRKSCDFGDGDTSGILSSSSGSSGAPVSFGQALRSAMEQHSPTEEEESFNEETEEEVERKKSSMQMGITQRLTTIARETGLVAQDFRCPMCRKSIGPYFNFAKYKMCGVDGLYYCMDCTKPGGTYSIPARVLHSWDWEIRTVSDRGRAFIEANLERPIINIEEMNPKLYDHVPALKTVLKLRERLQAVSLYLFNCRESIADDFRKRIQPRDYLYNKIHLYSFMDLQNVRSGNLEKQIQGWLKYAIGHVMGCVLCRQKGFVCEICDKTDVIYPFNTQTTHRCPDCFSVYHLDCAVGNPCPKCARRAEYQVKEKADMLFLD